MKSDSFELVWDVKTFDDEESMSSVIEELQKDGWEVYNIYLKEKKIIIKKTMRVRLED
tara:strand:- start:1204 stop:1377 length:174 start_codon:yes stop_codon:yes gene_type:complete